MPAATCASSPAIPSRTCVNWSPTIEDESVSASAIASASQTSFGVRGLVPVRYHALFHSDVSWSFHSWLSPPCSVCACLMIANARQPSLLPSNV